MDNPGEFCTGYLDDLLGLIGIATDIADKYAGTIERLITATGHIRQGGIDQSPEISTAGVVADGTG